jgi:3-hydroxyisobutyrate dehydrogenase-like beta-hydroxyacid dehydrogenase
MDVGFIGLGNMGGAIARNLLQAGHELAVHNRTRDGRARRVRSTYLRPREARAQWKG